LSHQSNYRRNFRMNREFPRKLVINFSAVCFPKLRVTVLRNREDDWRRF
jgi:hypothetical protein